MEAEDQEQIEHHIQTGGKYKEKQRNLTVADGPQEGGKQVIKNTGHDSAADQHAVGIRIGKNILRCIHKEKQRLHGAQTDHGYKDCDKDREQDAVCYTGADSLFILCTITL